MDIDELDLEEDLEDCIDCDPITGDLKDWY